MPNPKDPVKLQEYREKQRRIALERGFGKWMKGRKLSSVTVQKMSVTQLRVSNEPEERKRRSERAKRLGYGKWMKGKAASPKFVEMNKARAGKTYEELYGDRAEEEKKKRRTGNARSARRVELCSPSGFDDLVSYSEFTQAVDTREFVICRLCGRHFVQIQNHLLRTHRVSVEMYRLRFPDASIVSIVSSEKRSKRMEDCWENRTPEQKRVIGEKAGVSRRLSDVEYPERCLARSETKKEWNRAHPEEVSRYAAIARAACPYFDSSIERAIESLLQEEGVRFEKQKTLSFLPKRSRRHMFDFVLREARLVIEADGCLWHSCPECRIDLSGMEGLETQVIRDQQQVADVVSSGWRILRFWEHTIRDHLEIVRERIREALELSIVGSTEYGGDGCGVKTSP